MFYTLLRCEEVPKLKVSDLNGNNLRVTGKGRRTDVITLPLPTLKNAQRHATGKKNDVELLPSPMNRARKHLGVAIDMALVHYLSLGKPVQFISKLARHRSIQVTLTIFTDVIPGHMEYVFSDVENAPTT